MDPRTKIPALALLGLSCTDCTERTPEDPLVGTWLAADIDGDAFPLVDEGTRSGWQLDIDDEHRGRLAFYNEEAYDGAIVRTEYYAELTVDAAVAPKVRITVASDLTMLLGDGSYSETYAVTTRADDGDGYDAESGTGSDGYDSDGYDSDDGTGALDPDERSFDEFERELGDAVHPIGRGSMILECELVQDVLRCQREAEAGDDLRAWQLVRKPEE